MEFPLSVRLLSSRLLSSATNTLSENMKFFIQLFLTFLSLYFKTIAYVSVYT